MSVVAIACIAGFVLLGFVLRSRMDKTVSLPAGPAMTRQPNSIEALVAAGRKIEAIKLLREETGLGLRDAKDRIDELFRAR